MRKKLSLILVSSMLALSLFACGGAEAEKKVEEKTEDVKEDVKDVEDAAADKAEDIKEDVKDAKEDIEEKLEGELNVIATSDKYSELFDKFTEEKGVKVNILSMSSGDVLSKIKAEDGKPAADLWFGGGIDAFMKAASDGLLAPITAKAADRIAAEYKDENGLWITKGLTIVGFIANNDRLEELGLEAPKTWDDLTNTQYKDEIIMSNPAISGTNYAVVNALLQTKGEEAGWDFFKALNENIPFYGKRGSDPSTRTAQGDFSVGITYIDGTLDEKVEENNLSIIYPEDGMPYVPEGVAIYNNAENLENAEAFIEWLYGNDENLKKLGEIDQKNTIAAIVPGIEGIEINYDPETIMKEDLTLFGVQREEILNKWKEIAGEKGEDK